MCRGGTCSSRQSYCWLQWGRLCSHCLGTPLLKRCSCRYCGRDWLVTAGGLVNEQNMQAGKPGAVGRAGQSVGSHLILFDAVPAHIVVGISYLVLSVRRSQMAQRSSKSRLQRVVWPRIRAVFHFQPHVSTEPVPFDKLRGRSRRRKIRFLLIASVAAVCYTLGCKQRKTRGDK